MEKFLGWAGGPKRNAPTDRGFKHLHQARKDRDRAALERTSAPPKTPCTPGKLSQADRKMIPVFATPANPLVRLGGVVRPERFERPALRFVV